MASKSRALIRTKTTTANIEELKQWKLHVAEGRQCWKREPGCEQTKIERYHLGIATNDDFPALPETKGDPLQALRNAITFYSNTQTEDGHWAHDYGGPMFLMPGLIITCYLTGVSFDEPGWAPLMIHYLRNLQNGDGGWGLHIECKSTIFGSSLSYVSLRLLGVPADDEALVRARHFLHANGGAKGIPSWGKFWLAVLGVYEWSGLNPVPPELWLMPYSVPFHPGRFWCHCRMVYLPMSYIYGKKITAEITPFIRELRSELYAEPYDQIDWPSLRTCISPLDLYTPHPLILRFINTVLTAYEPHHLSGLRDSALEMVVDHVDAEDRSTKYIDIGPVNKAMNMLVVWHAHGADSSQFRAHVDRIPDYLWLANDGMKMQGYNGSQLWDTAFSVQAILASGLGDEFAGCLQKAFQYVDVCQVAEETPEREKYFRHISKGAWPFSSRDHGWPISDCTAEGLKAALQLAKWGKAGSHIAKERYFDAVNVILSLQNSDGGWPTYEQKRGSDLLEVLNPAEVFHNIMVDYSYAECTSACVQALTQFQNAYPYHRHLEVLTAIKRGAVYIKSVQRPDGSWYGSWGVCFTYGTWFGVGGLLAAGEPTSSFHIQQAVKFLLSKQNPDGGWGETFASCETMEYQNNDSQVVNTAWALLSLLDAGYENSEILQKAAAFLIARQQPNGNWEQEDISGVFNANCAISYSGYKNIFPIWALGTYLSYLKKKSSKLSAKL